MEQDQEKFGWFWMGLIVLSVLGCGLMLWDGIKIGCDGPSLAEGVAIVIGKPGCTTETEPERQIVYRVETRVVERPVIELETVRFLAWLIFPVTLIILGGTGVVLAVKAKLER